MTSLPDYWDMLSRHDWTYAMSDDNNVYKRGSAQQSLLERISHESPAHQKLFRDYHLYAWHIEGEGGDTPARPERPK